MLKPLLVLTTLIFLASCGGSDPTCTPGEQTFKFCSDDQVWECPVGTADQIAAKKAVEDRCKKEADPVQCLLESDQEMVPANLKADCAGGGQICKDDPLSTPTTATCEDKP